MPDDGDTLDPLLTARALVVHDLGARHMDNAEAVSLVDTVLSRRRWWIEQWPAGRSYLACLVAQDVQEALLEGLGRWPLCGNHPPDDAHEQHCLRVAPDLGEDPHWICERDGLVIAPVGALPRHPA